MAVHATHFSPHEAQLFGTAGAFACVCATTEADLADADLRGCDLTGADLSHARLRGVRLRGADLRGADLSGCEVDLVEWTGVRIDVGTAVLLARSRGADVE